MAAQDPGWSGIEVLTLTNSFSTMTVAILSPRVVDLLWAKRLEPAAEITHRREAVIA